MSEFEINDKLRSLSANATFGPIASFISERLMKSLQIYETQYNIINQGSVSVIELNVNAFKFSFCFWGDGQRFSFFIDDREVMDDYLDDEKDSEQCVRFLKTVFGLSIEIIKYKGKSDNKVYKIVYSYGPFREEATYKWNFWNKELKVERKIIPQVLI